MDNEKFLQEQINKIKTTQIETLKLLDSTLAAIQEDRKLNQKDKEAPKKTFPKMKKGK
jgi:hypothetical protein